MQVFFSQYYPPGSLCSRRSGGWFYAQVELAKKSEDVGVLTGLPIIPRELSARGCRNPWRRGFMREEREGVEGYPHLALSLRRSKAMGARPQFRLLRGLRRCRRARGWRRGMAWLSPLLHRFWWVFRVGRGPVAVPALGIQGSDLSQSLVRISKADTDSLLYQSVARVAKFLYRPASHIIMTSGSTTT